MDQEIEKSAEAVKAVAELGTEGVRAARDFLSALMDEPTQVAKRMLTDWLEVVRFERQVRLANRCRETLRQVGLLGKTRAVAPKFVLPIIECASLEEDDYLQDLWANLLTGAMDPTRPHITMAYIDVLKQLEKVDAVILKALAELFAESAYTQAVLRETLMDKIDGLDVEGYQRSVDNLIRLGCVTSYKEGRQIEYETQATMPATASFTRDWGDSAICLTYLGRGLVEACMGLEIPRATRPEAPWEEIPIGDEPFNLR